MMIWILENMIDCSLVKILCIKNMFYQSFILQFAYRTACSTKSKFHLNIFLYHMFFKETVYSKRWTTYTCLEREAVFEIWCCRNNFGYVFCHHQLSRIVCHTCFLCGNLLCISDVIYNTYTIYID